MIIKSKSIKGNPSAFGRLVEYLRRDSAVWKTKEGSILEIRHNVFGTPEQIVQNYIDNEAARIHRRANNVLLHHIILSLSGEDEVTPEMMVRLTREYIAILNQDALYYATVHMSEGNKNPHSHVLMSGVAAGISTRQSKEEFRQAKLLIESKVRELYPNLVHSEIDHSGNGKSKSDPEWQIEKRGKTSEHREIAGRAAALFELAMSRQEFLDLLAEDNLKSYTRKNEVAGIEGNHNFSFDKLNLDLSILDEREQRMEELEIEEEPEEREKDKDVEKMTVEEQRLKELEELDKGTEKEEV